MLWSNYGPRDHAENVLSGYSITLAVPIKLNALKNNCIVLKVGIMLRALACSF
jgi:hypothetical protein